MIVYLFEFCECPGIDVDAAFVVFAEVHELLGIIVFVEDVFSEIFLFLLSVLIHSFLL